MQQNQIDFESHPFKRGEGMTPSMEKAIQFLNSPMGWDLIFRDPSGAYHLNLSLIDEPHFWEQIKNRSVIERVAPPELLRLAVHSYLDSNPTNEQPSP